MSLKKYSFLTIFFYGLSLLLPSFLLQLNFLSDTKEIVLFGFVSITPYIASVIICSIATTLLIFYFYIRQNDPLPFEKSKKSIFKLLVLGLIGIVLSLFIQSYASMVEAWLFQSQQTSENTRSVTKTILELPIYVLITTLTAPIMEEFVFRRALLGIISRYSNFWIGAIISSLFFAIAHQDGHLLVYFSLGFFFSLLYYFTGSIWTSILTHSGMNAMVILIQTAKYYHWIH
ncbi:hypothetical protein RV11_GL000683 [Enterococcus phoeniculicola]|uniref:CAAX prenyl protease 2/Lysostaphin resistance protein A-like domain-containing protein n=1 Tax=Enterococcus phoeniculicola ATCC BAA-412 TaxID=1158610 RepID=R3W4H8_9ENTE|nr:type II CAAX endopeptidase family protein [Enterococcus phoeniculicola]EOL42512.1 hypothetical protein UC3_02864 [Enterococcus phoeniculicola ATCC BAA-412]EOT79209.1 hypothetical protein I589_00717 [Enterococcus phoeniculicola ATCC BAA-412]OJG70968.1 hypothetical protein RV11_GL000683 [Enterococcus phoeniculicola]